jgi:protein ImuA
MQEPVPTCTAAKVTAAEVVERLAAEVRRIEGLHHRILDQAVTTGCPALDRLLPASGLRRGTLVEWLAPGAGSGAATLALIAAREACRPGGLLAVLDAQRSFYPPAAAGLQVELEKLLIVRPPRRRDDAWALDQLLRSPAVGAVLAWPGDWEEHTFRRLQLAAEAGAGLGFLLRPSSVHSQPSWAELRLLAVPLAASALPAPLTVRSMPIASRRRAGRRWRLEVLRIRGANEGAAVEVELDERTGTLHESRQAYPVHLAPRVAAGTPRRRSRGA